MVSIDNQIKEADKTFKEISALQDLSRAASRLGYEKQAQEYERNMEDISTKLNDNVDKAIQDAYNSLTAQDNNGKLDTLDELKSFRNKLYQDLDKQITGFSDASISQMIYLTQLNKEKIDEKKLFDERARKPNEEISKLKKIYMDDNNNPILDSTGKPIPYLVPIV